MVGGVLGAECDRGGCEDQGQEGCGLAASEMHLVFPFVERRLVWLEIASVAQAGWFGFLCVTLCKIAAGFLTSRLTMVP